MLLSLLFPLSDAVGEWHQWDPGWWDGIGKNHPVHRSCCHDDRKEGDGPLPGGGPSFHSAQLDQWIQTLHTGGKRMHYWGDLISSDMWRSECLTVLCNTYQSLVKTTGMKKFKASLQLSFIKDLKGFYCLERWSHINYKLISYKGALIWNFGFCKKQYWPIKIRRPFLYLVINSC